MSRLAIDDLLDRLSKSQWSELWLQAFADVPEDVRLRVGVDSELWFFKDWCQKRRVQIERMVKSE